MKIKFTYSWLEKDYYYYVPLKTKTNRRITTADVEINGDFYVGVARCNPSDQFVKKIGREVALRNATSTMTPEQRRDVWDYYFMMCGG